MGLRAAAKKSGARMIMSSVILGTSLGVSGFAVAQFASAAGPSGSVDAFVALAPARILDTRFGIGATATPLEPNSSLDLQVIDRGGVPSDATAVVINITVEGPTEQSYLTAWPRGADRPTASNLNWVAGRTIANLATVKIGDAGQVSFYNFAGTVNVIADVAGYYHSVNLDDRYYTKGEVDSLIVAGNNFNPNLYYTKSELYAKAESGRQFFAAVTGSNGSVGANSGGVTGSRSSAGVYNVTFPSALSSCAATATISGNSRGSITATIAGSQVSVRTWDLPSTVSAVSGGVTVTGSIGGNATFPATNAPVTGNVNTSDTGSAADPILPGALAAVPATNVPATGLTLTGASGSMTTGTGSVDAGAPSDRDFNLTVMCA
ncbi:MAG: hypothetical protein AB7L13_12785 [Acidimicrobiia bacterium]